MLSALARAGGQALARSAGAGAAGWLAPAMVSAEISGAPPSALETRRPTISAALHAAAAAKLLCRHASSMLPLLPPQLAARGYATQIGRSLMFSEHGVPEKVRGRQLAHQWMGQWFVASRLCASQGAGGVH